MLVYWERTIVLYFGFLQNYLWFRVQNNELFTFCSDLYGWSVSWSCGQLVPWQRESVGPIFDPHTGATNASKGRNVHRTNWPIRSHSLQLRLNSQYLQDGNPCMNRHSLGTRVAQNLSHKVDLPRWICIPFVTWIKEKKKYIFFSKCTIILLWMASKFCGKSHLKVIGSDLRPMTSAIWANQGFLTHV